MEGWVILNVWLSMVTTIGLGAIIGGYTNHVAIQMLFRPHNPIYIGKFHVPFTPGIIPKRRDEMAYQMGSMVVKHLLTPEGIERKLKNEAFRQELTEWTAGAAQNWIHTDMSVREVLQHIGLEQLEGKTTEAIGAIVEQKISEVWEKYGTSSIDELLSQRMRERIHDGIPMMADFLLEKTTMYFESEEGKQRIAKMIDDFLASRGTLLNLVGMLFGNNNLADKVQPEVIKFLQQDGTRKLLCDVIENAWNSVKERKAETFLSEETIRQFALSALRIESTVDYLFSKSVREIASPYQAAIVQRVVPQIIERGLDGLVANLPDIMKKLHLAEIVQNEVSSFPTERLEEMVLSIIKSELRAITYLGALLGGLIGLVQGLLFLFMS